MILIAIIFTSLCSQNLKQDKLWICYHFKTFPLGKEFKLDYGRNISTTYGSIQVVTQLVKALLRGYWLQCNTKHISRFF